MIAEGKAAVHSRRRNQRNRSVQDERITVFNPRDHIKYLNGAASPKHVQDEASPSEPATCRHARVPSNATDHSIETVVPRSSHGNLPTKSASVGSLGDYSANLALFIKEQLKSIPTYQPNQGALSPASSRSCPDFPFPQRSSPHSPIIEIRRPIEAPKIIEIPAVRPPMQSAFSAWSSTDDEADDEVFPLPDAEPITGDMLSKASVSSTPSILSYYQNSNHRSFLFSSTPMWELGSPCMAKEPSLPDMPIRRDSTTEPHCSPREDDNNNYYSSSQSSHPQLTSSSVPSSTSLGSNLSYFDCKQRPISIASHMRERIIAALTPPQHKGKVLTAISPFEGAVLTNVHDVFVESRQRVRVDGLAFDMLRDFTFPSRITTPC